MKTIDEELEEILNKLICEVFDTGLGTIAINKAKQEILKWHKQELVKYRDSLLNSDEIEIQKLESKLFCEILDQFHHLFVTDKITTLETHEQFYNFICEKRREYLDTLNNQKKWEK